MTMKKILLLGCLLICFHTPLFSQEVEGEPKVILPNAVMEQVVKRIVTWYFKAPKKQKIIYFAAKNIKKEWLPAINNIEFVLLEHHEPDGYGRKVYFFREVEKSGKSYAIGFGYGDPHCFTVGDPWAFRVKNSRVRLWQVPGGWGSGCASGSSDGGGHS